MLVRPQGGGPCTLLLKGADDVVFDKLGKVRAEDRHPNPNPNPNPIPELGKVRAEDRQLVDESASHVDHFASQVGW